MLAYAFPPASCARVFAFASLRRGRPRGRRARHGPRRPSCLTFPIHLARAIIHAPRRHVLHPGRRSFPFPFSFLCLYSSPCPVPSFAFASHHHYCGRCGRRRELRPGAFPLHLTRVPAPAHPPALSFLAFLAPQNLPRRSGFFATQRPEPPRTAHDTRRPHRLARCPPLRGRTRPARVRVGPGHGPGRAPTAHGHVWACEEGCSFICRYTRDS
ncbi:hypothetical protein C8R44DRAFT_334395 [Mycena epipterygia]|nr:hypothetical protein C8R44DRAFT_334395 [Mycena epipterygia]